MEMLKYYTEFYNGIKKTEDLKSIDNRMFFVTDLDTVLDFADDLQNFVSDSLEETKEHGEMLDEISNFPERFMPKENILITVLPPEKHRNDAPIVVSAHMTTGGKLLTAGGGALHTLGGTKEQQSQLITATVSYIFTVLNSKDTKISYRETSFKTNSGREKIIPVVFIKNQKSQTKYQYYLPSNPNWTHSWECVGHWRKLNGIGKDRNGEYNQMGRTWVVPHIKGEGEVIKKTRVVK